jgi:hypothetical protein
MDDVELATLEALEILPERPLTPTERTHKRRRRHRLLADADLINELVALYGRGVTDGLIEGGFTARAFVRAMRLIDEDLDLWFEATGERLVFRNLGGAERLALECWLWETHDRARQPERYKPNKSPDHDRPWARAPARWAPRRWFPSGGDPLFPSGGNPLEISVGRAAWQDWELEDSDEWSWFLALLTAWCEWDVTDQDPSFRSLVALARKRLRRVVPTRYWAGVKGRPVRPFWWGSRLVRKRLPDDDALDRLATSTAIEAGL